MNKKAETQTTTKVLTFNVPNIVLEYKDEACPILTVRSGGSIQIEHTVTVDYYDEAVDERDQVFAIKAKNQINFAGLTIAALNDAIPNIAPSAPTASEYMALVGKPVMTYFDCRKVSLKDGDVYKVTRSTIVLP
jgi:hypothetical protein